MTPQSRTKVRGHVRGLDDLDLYNYKNLITATHLVQKYIVESEMGGRMDKSDPWYPLYQMLGDIRGKMLDEQDMAK